MIVPTIHLNGTSKESLLEDLDSAFDALDVAFNKLKRTAPNGRDYYPQGPDALQKATDEHFDRLRKVQEVVDDLQSLMIAIDEQ